MAEISNLYIDQGSDYGSLVTVASASGAPLNLAPYTVKAQMRKSYGSSSYHDITAEVYNPAAGQIKLSLTAAQSENIPAGRWLYDVEITHTSTGVRKRVVEGIAVVTPQITRS